MRAHHQISVLERFRLTLGRNTGMHYDGRNHLTSIGKVRQRSSYFSDAVKLDIESI